MAVELDMSTLHGGQEINLSTTPGAKRRRVMRLKDDLDKFFVEEDTRARATLFNINYIDLYGFPIDTTHLQLLTQNEVETYRIGCFKLENRDIYLATPSPNFPGQSEIINKLIKLGYKPIMYLCSEMSLQKLINTYKQILEQRFFSDDINITQDKITDFKNQKISLTDLQTYISKISTSEVVEVILIAAIQNKASDIHFEPEKDSYHLRLRLDGVLQTFAVLPTTYQKTIESRLKIISGVKINIDNKPQDGRFSFKYEEKDIDVRVSMLPSNYGYSIVMRLLGTGNVALDLESLGFVGLSKQKVLAAIGKPQGLILTTGPTGSGKTTTLYTFLETINDGQTKIITLEDPIEYKVAGVSQTQIDPSSGYTFSGGLRSIMRQDPDVVLVGEIRDPETAEIAIQASLTGHQVLSTIHTNDAAGAIPRMMEMGIRGFLLADSLEVIIGQRLVRKICQECKIEHFLNQEEQKIVLSQLAAISPAAEVKLPSEMHFYKSTGCPACGGLGYKGRVGVYEVLTVTNGLRSMLANSSPSIAQVREVATKEGMLTMFQDGLIKAIEGQTSLEELRRNVSF